MNLPYCSPVAQFFPVEREAHLIVQSDKACQWFYILKPPYNFSQFCILIKPKLLNWSGGKAVLTQIWHKTHINSKKTRISKLQFGEERYYNWLNQIKSVFKIFLPSLIPQILICARLCTRYWIYLWIEDNMDPIFLECIISHRRQ